LKPMQSIDLIVFCAALTNSRRAFDNWSYA
jgi:hypothetical protein